MSHATHSGAKMSELIAAHDWRASPLGAQDEWPDSLTTALSMCLSAQLPMMLWWGSELTLFYNDACIPILGAKHPAALGSPGLSVRVWGNAPSRALLEPALRFVVQRGEPASVQEVPYELKRRGSFERAFMNASFSPIQLASGALAGVLLILHDHTEHVLAEKRDAELERTKLRDLFMQAPALIAIQRGPEHVFEFVNSAAERLVGKVVGYPVSTLFPEQRAFLDGVYETGERFLANEQAVTFDWDVTGVPSVRYFNWVYEPFRDLGGNVAGILTFAFEVTEQVLARKESDRLVQELEASARTKDEFLATISHELRTPLNAILGWSRMLRTGTLSEDRVQRAVETIERNAKAQAQLIEDLLDVSRIISGKLRLELEPVLMPAIVAHALESVRPSAQARGIVLAHTIDAHAGMVLGDADRLQQVVWNLLSNAVKFCGKGGHVHVTVQKAGDSVEVSVRDDGQGIDPEFLPFVFERFRQADASTTRAHGGLGLGLAIVRHLVELHGGTVRAESAGQNRGATFTVRLPNASSRSQAPGVLSSAQARRSAPTRAAELAGLRVVVLDDELDARDLTAAMLTQWKVRVWTADNVADALRLVQAERPDIVLSDIGMPENDGYVFIQRLRGLPAAEGGNTKAVALTAYARSEDRTRVLEAGFDQHVPKPVDPTELRAVLSRLNTR